jgi:type IV pilus assembly protein PilY1
MTTLLRHVALAVLAVAGALPAARADDTEVFLAEAPPPDTGRANILFIIDNSGSMDTLVETQLEYDPGTTYAGCYRADALYFATSTSPPPCSSTAYVNKPANRCAASAAALSNLGQYTGRVLAWDASRERWDVPADGAPDRPLECEADQGLDGDGSDTEPYAANGPEGPWAADEAQVPAWNNAYTLSDGNWLNWRADPPTALRTRLEIVQGVVNDVIDGLDGVNVGLMQFNANEGGAVVQAVADVDDAREQIKDAVNGLEPLGSTPLSETLYEAALYMRGGNVDYGDVGPDESVAAARVGNDPAGVRYRAPMSDACQKNFIVLLTDGEPTRDTSANAKIRSLPNFASVIGSCDGAGNGACLDDLADYLFQTDANAALEGTQNVVTYTIGFAVDVPLLESTATRGGGQYYVADDTSSLTAALTDLVTGTDQSASVFAAPAVPVSAFGTTPAERDVYVSVFQPTQTVHWPGNLKKYRFADGRLVDENGEPAVNAATGFFAEDAQGIWSADPDGDRVTEGGAANRLPTPSTRKVYTDIAGPDLTDNDNRVAVTTTAITEAVLGVVGSAERTALINWIRGADVLDTDGDGNRTEARREMGDPLHVRPVAVEYGTAGSPDSVVFTATNDGFLHAVDADTGVEIWSYLPSRLLPRQNALYLDQPTSARGYGLDGEIRLFRGTFADGTLHSVLVFGMGRGGDAVYALDITARNAPRLLWQIDSSTPGFASLGQTWAAPPVPRVRTGAYEGPVVVLSGGYDDGQDNRGYRVDTVGNAIFMVRLDNGERLWSAGDTDAGDVHELKLAKMQNSIPAAPRVIDLSGDGLADRIYVGDTGGRLWRFDVLNGNAASSLVEGGVLAELGAAGVDSPPASAVRRFHSTPDVVFVECLRGTFLAVNIGSGYRGHPLDTDVEDAFFSVRDANVYQPIDRADYPEVPIRIADLLDITTDPTATVPADSDGWLLRMVEDEGEKILNSALTFRGITFFTSFSPGARVDACSGGIGINRLYQVDVCNGRPVNNLDGSADPDTLSTDDRFRLLSQAGIAAGPMLLLDPTGATVCTGPECFRFEPPGPGLPRTYWSQETAR